MILIAIYSSFSKRSSKQLEEKLNLGIIIEQDISDNQINNIISDIKKVSSELKFISMSRTSQNTSINLDLKPKKFQSLTFITEKIKKKYSNSKVILSYNDDLSL